MRFSARTGWPAEPNPLSRKIEAMRAAGKPFIDLTESNPTRCDFKYLCKELLGALTHPDNLSYKPDPRGREEARLAVARYYAARGAAVDSRRIFLTSSTSEAYQFVFRLLCDPGDGLYMPGPSYPLFEYLGGLNDVELLSYALAEKDGAWRIDPGTLTSRAVKGIVTVHPNNPTGHYADRDDMAALNEFCRKNGAAVISDEVFLDYRLAGQGPVRSFVSNTEVLTFTLSGISKILGLPQMKLAWIVVSGPEKDCEEAMRRLEVIADAYLPVSSPVQLAMPAWMERQEAITGEIRGRLLGNLDFLRILKQPRLKFHFPEGGWYVPFEWPEGRTDEAWSLHVLEKAGVLAHPGYLFDFEGKDFGVISLLPEPDRFREGVEKMLAACGG